MFGRFGVYRVPEQSVLVRAVPDLIVGKERTAVFFRLSVVPDLHTSGQKMLKYICMQKFIKIYHVVQELRAFVLAAN